MRNKKIKYNNKYNNNNNNNKEKKGEKREKEIKSRKRRDTWEGLISRVLFIIFLLWTVPFHVEDCIVLWLVIEGSNDSYTLVVFECVGAFWLSLRLATGTQTGKTHEWLHAIYKTIPFTLRGIFFTSIIFETFEGVFWEKEEERDDRQRRERSSPEKKKNSPEKLASWRMLFGDMSFNK